MDSKIMIYEPEEDSFLLSKYVRKYAQGKVLDMGTGTGIQAIAALENTEEVLAVDINEEAVEYAKKKNINAIQSDLFENVEGKYGIIVFNPPYLPKDSREPTDSQLATTGGLHGSEIINEFLKEAKNYLEEKGKIFLLTSSLTKNINWNNYHKKLLGKEKLFFEELFVWELIV